MNDERDTLPSDREDAALKPKDERKREPTPPPADDKKAEQDPSEQPS